MRRLGVLLSNSDLSQAVLRTAVDCEITATVLPKDWFAARSRDVYDFVLTDAAKLEQCFPSASGRGVLLLAVAPDDDLTALLTESRVPLVGLVRTTHLAGDLEDTLRLAAPELMPADDAAALSSSLIRIDSCYALPSHRNLAFAAARALRHCLQVHAGASAVASARVAAAAFEAFENAMFHGNLELSSGLRQPAAADAYAALLEQRQRQHPYRDRRVWITTRITPHDVHVTVRDEGQGFDVSQWNHSTPAASGEPGCFRGRGWLVMQHFCSNVRYNDAGNEVTLTVLLADTLLSSHSPSSVGLAPSPLV